MVAPPLRYETGIVLPVCLGRFRGGSLQLEGLAPGPEKRSGSLAVSRASDVEEVGSGHFVFDGVRRLSRELSKVLR